MSKQPLIAGIVFVALSVFTVMFAFSTPTHAQEPLVIPPALDVAPPPQIQEEKPASSVFYTKKSQDMFFATDEISIRKQDGEKLFYDVELALTADQMRQGLMHRTEMADNAGMLFVFGDVAMRSFWMKNTLIPLDMLFIHSDGTIHHIHHNAKPQDLTSITSKYPSLAVLELNGGTADKMGIKEGDVVEHTYFKNVGIGP